MASPKRSLFIFSLVVVLCAATFVYFRFYPYLFSITLTGKIEKIERVQINVSLMQSTSPNDKINPELYSFAVAIQTDDGRIWTASAEDRQWASISPGICVKAKYFPYAPWRLDKSGTYFGARLLEAWDCSTRQNTK